jgi:hypothetical protein
MVLLLEQAFLLASLLELVWTQAHEASGASLAPQYQAHENQVTLLQVQLMALAFLLARLLHVWHQDAVTA